MTVSDLALIGITDGDLVAIFSWGFGAMAFGWSAGYAINIFRNMISKI
jgi:hypothetical protein